MTQMHTARRTAAALAEQRRLRLQLDQCRAERDALGVYPSRTAAPTWSIWVAAAAIGFLVGAVAALIIVALGRLGALE